MVAAVVACVAIELVLQVAAFWAPDRSGAWRAGARHRILCAGDSHTWGAGVERADSYPAQLQQRLDETAPGEYSVMNVGVPGMNTSQLRKRVPQHIGRHAPDLLLVWAGINNEWNSAEVDEPSPRLLATADRLLLRSRVYRFFRIWVHDRGLERYPTERRQDLAWQPETDSQTGRIEDRKSWTIRHDGVVEALQHRSESVDISRIERIAVEDFRAIAKLAASTGTRLVFVGYPLNVGGFERANAAMWQVSREFDLQFVHSWKSLARVSASQREWLWAMHPGRAIYAEIVRDVQRAVVDPTSQRRGDAIPASEFQRANRAQWTLVLRAARQVALAAPPFEDAERAMLESLRQFYAADLELDALMPIAPAELARALDPDLHEVTVELLQDLAAVDGSDVAAEQALVAAVADALAARP